MAKNKTKQFNIRIDEDLYNKIKEEADEQDITMTEYVIGKLTDDSERIDDSYKKSYIEALQQQIERQGQAIQANQVTIQELTAMLRQKEQDHTKLLDQQQQLTLATQKDKERLSIELDEIERKPKKWQFWK